MFERPLYLAPGLRGGWNEESLSPPIASVLEPANRLSGFARLRADLCLNDAGKYSAARSIGRGLRDASRKPIRPALCSWPSLPDRSRQALRAVSHAPSAGNHPQTHKLAENNVGNPEDHHLIHCQVRPKQGFDPLRGACYPLQVIAPLDRPTYAGNPRNPSWQGLQSSQSYPLS